MPCKILIFSWPWALFGSKFCIICSLSLLQKFSISKHFLVMWWMLRGISMLLLSLKSVIYSFPWEKNAEWQVPFYYSKTFLIIPSNNKYLRYYCFYYLNSFYKHCFPLGWDFFREPRGSLITWCKPNCDEIFSIALPSIVVISLTVMSSTFNVSCLCFACVCFVKSKHLFTNNTVYESSASIKCIICSSTKVSICFLVMLDVTKIK